MTGDSAGLLLVIDRLGRTIAELEAKNAQLEQRLNAFLTRAENAQQAEE